MGGGAGLGQMAVAITFATQTSAAGFEPQTPGSRKKAQIKQMPSAQRPAGLPEQDLCPLESVSPRPHPGKPKHLLVKVLRRGPLLAHFGIHSFTHSFTRHVIPSITGRLKAPLPQARSSVSLQSIPEPMGSAPAEVRGLYPHPVSCLSRPIGRAPLSQPKSR